MHQRQPDPFFEQLKADVEEGIAAADHGDLIDADTVWEELRARVHAIEFEREGPPSQL